MYGLAYVFIPSSFKSLQAELDLTLAPFMRGGEDEFPRDKLAFDDATERLRDLHRSRFRYNPDGSLTLLDAQSASSFDLRAAELSRHMAACGLDRFEGTFAEVEPDFAAFMRRFADCPRDPATGRYGRWLNPIGYWDWWELGGRFNGVITGDRRAAASDQIISSGPSPGRNILGNLVVQLGGGAPDEAAQIEANVELVETLEVAAGRDEMRGLPTAIVLPIGCGPDDARWFDRIEWHETRPETRALLGVPPDADFRRLARAAFDRYRGNAAAGVAYHF
jgi:hypothetical protein